VRGSAVETDVVGGAGVVERVELWRVDGVVLAELLAVAVADAEPEEVMPPVAGPPGWTGEREDAFRAWHRDRRAGLDGPLREVTFAVVHGDTIVGSARLARRGADDTLETGLWLGRSHRGQGIGTATLSAVLDEAARAGAGVVVADTTVDNAGSLAALRRNGAVLTTHRDTGEVHAELRPEKSR
jgi:RimJ/RimL family protein N-acetyltransferase